MLGAHFAELCRPSGDGLPYPDPSPARLDAIVAGLGEAWPRMKRAVMAADEAVSALDEDQITTLLIQALYGVMDDEAVPGFLPEFVTVHRDPKVVNHDGRHPDKMPDLAFSLRPHRPGLGADYAVHVECKPVGRAHGHKPYRGRNGMGCFIHGDYGCKMRVGLMVAYADPGYTFDDKVLPVLSSALGSVGDMHHTTALPSAGQPLPQSRHRRAWRYADGSTPGDIRLLHIWLTR